jgi:hypothetical protein
LNPILLSGEKPDNLARVIGENGGIEALAKMHAKNSKSSGRKAGPPPTKRRELPDLPPSQHRTALVVGEGSDEALGFEPNTLVKLTVSVMKVLNNVPTWRIEDVEVIEQGAH